MPTDPLVPLNSEASRIQNTLNASNTAYGGDQLGTRSDVENQVRLKSVEDQMQKIRDTQLTKKWGLGEGEGPGEKMGVIGTALDYLQRPGRAIEATAEHVLGQGVRPGLADNITENISTGKRTFSDLLRKEGANWIVAAPLGFALDVALDPLNWATAGTGAIVPRALFKPLAMAATGDIANAGRAAIKGVQSSSAGVFGARVAKKIGEKTPYLKDTGIGQSMARATDSAAAASDEYAKLIGRDFMGDVLPKTGMLGTGLSNYRIGLADIAKHAVRSLPGGETIWNNLKYSNADWLRMVRLKDALEKAEGTAADATRVAKGMATPSEIQAGAKELAESQGASKGPNLIDWEQPGGAFGMGNSTTDKGFSEAISRLGRADAPEIQQAVKDAADIAQNTVPVTADRVELGLRMASEAAGRPILSLDELKQLVNDDSIGTTGIQWYDNMIKNVRDLKISTNANVNKLAPVIQKTLDAYDKWMTLFRAAKVTGSPSSVVNATVGNPAFYGFLGGDITDSKYWKMLSGAAGYNLGTRKSSAFWQKLLDKPHVKQWIDENPTAILTGFSIPSTDRQQTLMAKELLRIMKDHSMVNADAKITDKWLTNELDSVMRNMREVIATNAVNDEGQTFLQKTMGLSPRGGLKESLKTMQKKGAATTRNDVSTGMFAQEYLEQPAARKMLDAVAERAKTGGPVAKALNIWLNKMPSFYEGIDGSYKLGTFAHLTLNGWTERELNIARRTIDFRAEDIVDRWNDNGVWRYRIAPDKAMEVVMESYLNYAAMPGFIRMMRQMPLLGAPFVSFAYGASLKTANTLATNPAFFNKVSYALNDFGGAKSPLEKEAINDSSIDPKTGKPKNQYYNYLNNPTMFKIPFFQDNPVYLNLGYALPYYSLNAFTPSGRAYKELLPDAVVKTIDKSQLMGNPIGQVLFDYGILPHLLSQSEDPQGAFGQNLYPNDAGALDKMFYAARQLGESVVPGALAASGAPIVQGLAAPGLTDWVPSYRWRQIANASQGLDQYGISRKEPATSRTLRGIGAAWGVPVQSPIDLTNISNSVKKKK